MNSTPGAAAHSTRPEGLSSSVLSEETVETTAPFGKRDEAVTVAAAT